ncbi:hypothetical protein ACAW49_20340, partial [Pseudomonas sp. Env-44]|uniref:hypothetical protein n=1 Tax=unclassified Pseudomonas TaxID=196821 RepID=UPI003522D725
MLRNQTVGLACEGGLKADTYLSDPTRSKCGSWLACEGGLAGDTVDCVHIHSCGNGHLGFRFYSGSLLEG